MKISDNRSPDIGHAHSARPSTTTPSRFPVVGRTTATNEPIVGRINHGEWCILQDGRVASPAGTRTLAGRVILSAPAMDFNLIRIRDGVVQSLLKGMVEDAPSAFHHPVGESLLAPDTFIRSKSMGLEQVESEGFPMPAATTAR